MRARPGPAAPAPSADTDTAPAAADLAAAVQRTIRRHAMLVGGDTVVVAVSGGADSVGLLLLLHALARDWRLTLHVAHVDHRLRPDSARDAELVRALGRRLDVPVHVLAVEVARRGSREAAARAARYAALTACADRVGATRIAVGHTLDDQGETVLMRVLEGAGPRGLAGIPAVRERVIRPLIEIRRAAVRAFVAAVGVPWTDDPTNEDPDILRNRVRHELVPTLGTYNPAIVEALGRVARLTRQAVEAIDAEAAAAFDRLAVPERGGLELPLDELRRLPRAVALAALRAAAARVGGDTSLRAWGYRELGRVLAHRPPPAPFIVNGVTVEVSCGRVRVGLDPASVLPRRAVPIPGAVDLPEAGLTLVATLHAAPAYALPPGRDRVAFDVDTLPHPLVVRARAAGDRFTPFGARRARRLKSVLIAARLPRWARARLPIVEGGGEIVWVGGLRRGALAPVTTATRQVVELALVPLAATPGSR